MNKKQIGALLKVISKDKARTAINNIYIDIYEGKTCIVATDGYMMAVHYIEGLEDHVGKMISRDLIERWYKLANNRSYFGIEAINELLELKGNKEDYFTFPVGYKELIKDNKPTDNHEVTFNAEMMNTLQTLAGKGGMSWVFGDTKDPIVAKNNEGVYVLMPLIK